MTDETVRASRPHRRRSLAVRFAISSQQGVALVIGAGGPGTPAPVP
jgi:hypothetical protein